MRGLATRDFLKGLFTDAWRILGPVNRVRFNLAANLREMNLSLTPDFNESLTGKAYLYHLGLDLSLRTNKKEEYVAGFTFPALERVFCAESEDNVGVWSDNAGVFASVGFLLIFLNGLGQRQHKDQRRARIQANQLDDLIDFKMLNEPKVDQFLAGLSQ